MSKRFQSRQEIDNVELQPRLDKRQLPELATIMEERS